MAASSCTTRPLCLSGLLMPHAARISYSYCTTRVTNTLGPLSSSSGPCTSPPSPYFPSRFQGFELLPMTLEVGDYVLAPTTAVERKSVPDLHASLASGRWGGGCRDGEKRTAVEAGREAGATHPPC